MHNDLNFSKILLRKTFLAFIIILIITILVIENAKKQNEIKELNYKINWYLK